MGKFVSEFKYISPFDGDMWCDFLKRLGGDLITGSTKIFPFDKVEGGGYFLELSSDLKVFVVTLLLKEPFKFTFSASEEGFLIVYYDLSNGSISHVVNDVVFKRQNKSKKEFFVVDGSLDSSFIPKVGVEVSFLQLFVRKSVIENSFYDRGLKEDFRGLFEDREWYKKYYYGVADGRSRVVLYNLKRLNVLDYNYEFFIKSSVYKLLGFFIDKMSFDLLNVYKVLERDLESVKEVNEFLLLNISKPFPGIKVLAGMAKMSVTKFRSVYFDVFGLTPAVFFKNEKFRLAKKILESNEGVLFRDVALQLGYSNISYFLSVYKKYHGSLPVKRFDVASKKEFLEV